MAIASFFRQKAGTPITFKASGGTAAITFASLATSTSDLTGARQSVKADFQVLGSATDCTARIYAVTAIFDWVTTAPTSNATLDIFLNPSSNTVAGTDNKGGCVGTDSAYTGIASDISISSKQLLYVGTFVCSSLVGPQNSFIGFVTLPDRYGSIVVWNKSGRLLNATEGTQSVTFTPINYTSDAS